MGRSTITKSRILSATLVVSFALSGSLASVAGASTNDALIEEIVVTATYRETNLLDTPLAITALDEQALIEKGILNMQSLYQAVPGMNYGTKSGSYNNVTIRGLTAPAGGGSVVGIYLDDIPITDSNDGGGSQPMQALYDVQRVEVLKGPQGTLYGEGNMGGALRYITNKPDPSGFDVSFGGQTSQDSESDDLAFTVNGMVNIPLVEEVLALRISGQYRDDPGFLDVGGTRDENDVNYTEEEALRAKLAWYVNENVSIDATVNSYKSEGGGPTLSNIPHGTTDTTSLNFEQQFGNGSDIEDLTYNLSLNWELPWADLLVSSSYYDRDIRFVEETPARFRANAEIFKTFYAGFIPGFPLTGAAVEAVGAGDALLRRRTERSVQEIRLVSNGDSAWQWTAGLYYKDDKSVRGDDTALGFENIVLTPAYAGFESLFMFPVPETEIENTEVAAYGELSYDISEKLNLLFGLRYAEVTSELANSNLPDVDDSYVSPKATVTFRPANDHMIYFTVAQGFRPGVINASVLQTISNIQNFAPGAPGAQAQIDFLNSRITVEGDELFNYELGYKASLLDGRLQGAAAIYYMDWKDTLITRRFPTVFLDSLFSENAGDAHSQGIELEFDLKVTDNLSFQFGGSWNHEAEIESATESTFADAMGVPLPIREGNRMAYSPEFTGNLALDYRFPIAGFDGSARADWYYIDSQFNDAGNEIETPSYSTLNLRFAIAPADAQWTVALFGKNVANEEIIYEDNQSGQVYGPGRTIGLEFSWKPGR